MSSPSDTSTTVALRTGSQEPTTAVSSITNTPSLTLTTTPFASPPSSNLTTNFASPASSPSTSLNLPVAPSILASTDSPDNGPSLAIKVGIGAGAGVLILFIIIAALVILHRRNKSSPPVASQSRSKVSAGVLRLQDPRFDAKHHSTKNLAKDAVELKQGKEANRLQKSRRNSQLATVSEEPNSRPLPLVTESMNRTVSPLTYGPASAEISTGHISFIQPDDRLSSIAQSQMRLSSIPLGDRLSFAQPGDRSSIAPDINGSRQAALEVLSSPSSPISPVDERSPINSIGSRLPPSVPPRSPRRYSVQGHELDINCLETIPSTSTAEPPPRSRGSQSLVVDLYTGSSKYAP